MTLRDWLRARQPAPPAALLARMEEALGPGDVKGEPLSERAMAAAERLLASILADPDAGRPRALDLLAADALVTYAIEADCRGGADVEARSRAAMARLASLVAPATESAAGAR